MGNINVIFGKIGLLHFSGMHASEYQIALDLFDLALNIHSRFLGDDTNSYAFILLSKAMKIHEITNSKKSKQIAEWMYSCLEIFYEDEENNKEYIQDAHRYLAYFHKETSSIDDSTMHGRKVIKLEKEIYGGIRRLGEFGIANWLILRLLGVNICGEYSDTSKKLKKIDFDEATDYLEKAKEIVNSHPDVPSDMALDISLLLSNCASKMKEDDRRWLILSKIDKTDRQFRKAQTRKKETIDEFEVLLKTISQKNYL